jgi:hypothetical protein
MGVGCKSPLRVAVTAARALARVICVGIALSGTACAPDQGPIQRSMLNVELPGLANAPALNVAIEDETGTVVNVTPGSTTSVGVSNVVNVPGRPNAIEVRWIALTCERNARIKVVQEETLRMLIRSERPGECPAFGVTRAIVLEFTRRISVSTVDVDVDNFPLPS